MRTFKTKPVARIARQLRISDQALKDAIERAGRGLIDADLGGGLIKQRVARPGQGRSGGHRTIVAYRAGQRAVFLYAFAKNELDNITADELRTFKELGTALLEASETKIAQALQDGTLKEVKDDDETDPHPRDEGPA